MDKEIWQQTKYDNYLVSNYGRVLSKGDETNRYKRNFDTILSPANNGRGYLFVNIEGKDIYVHRLVAETFIPNPNNYLEINHKNENKQDNSVNNLEWCDKKYNVSYSIGRKVKQIDINTKKVIAIFNSAIQAAESVNGNNTSILACCKHKNNSPYKGYIWRFVYDFDYTLKNKKYYIVRLDKNNKETIYNSIKEAAQDNNVSIYSIYNALNRKSKILSNYVWFKRQAI